VKPRVLFVSGPELVKRVNTVLEKLYEDAIPGSDGEPVDLAPVWPTDIIKILEGEQK
jgi:hypothetical protein